MKNTVVAVAAASLMLMGSLVGCSSQPSAVIGVESESVAPVTITNETGQGVSAVEAKLTGTETYDSALEQSEDLADGAQALLYCPVEELKAAADDGQLNDVVLDDAVDLRFTLASGSSYEIHQLNVADLSDVRVCYDEAENMVYLIYTSVGSGNEVNTLEIEKNYLQQLEQQKAEEEARLAAEREAEEKAAAERAAAEQAAREEAERKAAEEEAARQAAEEEAARQAEEEAARQAEAEAAARAERENRKSMSSGSSSSSSNSSGAGEDACVDDIILD